MQHVSFTPASPLASFVERFWFVSDAPAHRNESIVPSGTIELVFNLAEDRIRICDTHEPTRQRRFSGAVFSGAYSKPFVIDMRDLASALGVHFRPGGAFPFLGVPASELADSHVDLETVWGKSAARELRERLCTAATPLRRFRVLESVLTRRLKDCPGGHPAVSAAIGMVVREGATTRLLADALGLSQRHLIHVFSKEVGMAPKLFHRVQRFQRALALSLDEARPDWADVAAASGYYDQSHFIHDFRAFSGFSPTQLPAHGAGHVMTNHIPVR